MAPRAELEKKAWAWAIKVNPDDVKREHIETAYRIHLPPCKATCRLFSSWTPFSLRERCMMIVLLACRRRNCRGNPNCLSNLGERRWFTEEDGAYLNGHKIRQFTILKMIRTDGFFLKIFTPESITQH